MLQEKDGIRLSTTGATRDSELGKLEYSRFIHPLADYSYAEYMKTKQIIGGEYRRGDNWQKGLGAESLFDSLIRHIEVLKLLMKGYNVYEYKKDGETLLHVISAEEDTGFTEGTKKTIVSECNAIRFNSEGLKLYGLGIYKGEEI